MLQQVRQLLHILAMLCIGSIAIAQKASAQITPKGLPTLQVYFSEKQMPKEYTNGSMKLTYTDGTSVELSARFKTRGATASQYTMKPSFNMKLRDQNDNELDTTLCGLRSMSSYILDAMAIDRIGMRNRVAFDTWNEFSRLPYETQFDSRNGTVGQFVEVYFNDSYKGIYCMTDRINRKLLDLKKPQVETSIDPEGNTTESVTIRGVIYKHGTNSIGDQNSRRFSEDSTAYVIKYHDAWELTEPEEYAGAAAWAPLDTIYQHADDYEWVKEHFYLEQLADYQIFVMALSIVDNWGNKNAYISARNVTADGNKRRFVYTPWDLDTSLGGAYDGSKYDGNYTNWTPADVMKASGKPHPFSICNRQDEFRTMLKQAWIRGRDGALSYDAIRDKMHKYRDLFIGSGAWERETSYWETQKYKPPYVTDLAREIDQIMDWYETRYMQMDEYFGIETGDAIATTQQHMPANNDSYYNLMGMRMHTPATPGIYIHKGRKYVIR